MMLCYEAFDGKTILDCRLQYTGQDLPCAFMAGSRLVSSRPDVSTLGKPRNKQPAAGFIPDLFFVPLTVNESFPGAPFGEDIFTW
jgi:hypothetical protein